MAGNKTFGIKGLIGEEVMLLSRWEVKPAGPFILAAVSPPFIGVMDAATNEIVWFNWDYIVSIKGIVDAK